MLTNFREQVANFQGGRLKSYLPQWKELTHDHEVLSSVSGLPLEFHSTPLFPEFVQQCRFSQSEEKFVSEEIARLVQKNIIVPCEHEEGEFISAIFLTPKGDGTYRLILNLKKLNEAMPYVHFKMDTIHTVLSLVTPGCFMTKIDIKDAYYSVPILPEHQKFLKFMNDGILYKFLCLPNGLCSGPRKFTKLLKPPLASLRKDRVTLSAYIDDIISLARTFELSRLNTSKCVTLLSSLGFVLHPDKCQLVPSTCIEYLGFIIDSVTMQITLNTQKKQTIKELCQSILHAEKPSIRMVAQLLGKFSSSFPATMFGRLHYRSLECEKIFALRNNLGKFDAPIYLGSAARNDILWWSDNVMDIYDTIGKPNPTFVITTDASKTGWGASFEGVRTGGLFTAEETDLHINVLELMAVLFGLRSLCNDITGDHCKILSDNTTAVFTINNMGTCKSYECNNLVKEIWEWARCRGVWLSSSHIAGTDNTEADEESRKCDTLKEWKLNKKLFDMVVSHFNFVPDVDLFASRINCQLPNFFSLGPDPEASLVNAFSTAWTNIKFYCFPPFACIARCIQKVIRDEATGLMVVPNWPNQPWFTLLFEIMISEPYIVPYRHDNLYLPSHPSVKHPLKLELMVWHVSGKVSQNRDYQMNY